MEQYEKIKKAWSEISFRTTADIDHTLSDFKVLFAYHSGKIENDEITYDTTLEVFEGKRILNFSGDYRTLYEVVNQKDCYQFLLDCIVEKRALSIDFIKKIQYELAKHTYDDTRIKKGEIPGSFKKGFYVVGEYQVGSAPEQVEKDLSDLVDELNEYSGDNLLRAVAYFHLVFERIHPFADANGRTGRTLMNYYLMTHNHPPIVIREGNRKEYVAAFDRFHYDADLIPMEDYLRKETVNTWRHIIREPEVMPKHMSLDELDQIIQKERTVKQKDKQNKYKSEINLDL